MWKVWREIWEGLTSELKLESQTTALIIFLIFLILFGMVIQWL